ncbi:MAG TPA: NADH-quinone oxidoreductase subunit C [Leucothrix mucor]|nr:NADH-quinone oxidoreductase subunit C [Leucothrix mucor]
MINTSPMIEALQAELSSSLADKIQNAVIAFNELTIEIAATDLVGVAQQLRDSHGFAQLIDLCAVDYLSYGESEWDADVSGFSRGVKRDDLFDFGRDSKSDANSSMEDGRRYAVVIHLLSVENNNRVRVKIFCEDNDMPMMDSVNDVWNSANWFEREAFDLFGVIFVNHPDLRRILTDYGFVGHPFRKDFPLIGQVEMRYDEELKRVVYEPVSIEPRVLVPRVIRASEGTLDITEADD